jgi:hypothetical protein
VRRKLEAGSRKLEVREFFDERTFQVFLVTSSYFLKFLKIQFLINLTSISKKLKPICQNRFFNIENIHTFANNK